MISLLGFSSPNPTVSQEEFNTFHNIDRTLYIRFVLGLNRDPVQSIQVVAFLIWLEKSGQTGYLVDRMLSFPDSLINSLADEALLCLNFIQTHHFSSSDASCDIPLISGLIKLTGLSIRFFQENRLGIIRGVSKIISEVCDRAFEDISELVTAKKKSNVECRRGGGGGVKMNRRKVVAVEEEKDDEHWSVPPDERTIFLTFSKGYPISQDEVRDFFTRKYGDCIEAIHMQEVTVEDQPLYARLVVRSPAVVHVILDGTSKAKFSINGKHVWARKYVRKCIKPSSPPPTSPAAVATSFTYGTNTTISNPIKLYSKIH